MSTQISTFISAFEEYKVFAKKRHKKQGYDTHIRNISLHILPYFKDVKDMRKLVKKDIIIWLDKILDKNFSNSFNSGLYYAFSSFVQFCMDFGYMEENIVLSVSNFSKKIEKKEKVIFNLFQLRKFRFCLTDYIDKQFFNFMFFNGPRPSEAMALRFTDLKGCNATINHSIERKGTRTLDTPKNQSSIRTFKISMLMRFRIWKLKRLYTKKCGTFNEEFFVFGGMKPLAPSTIDRHIRKACDKAKLPHITQHGFRHSYATRSIHNNVPIDVVSRNMGHSKISMTCDVYLHQEKRILSIPFRKLFF